MGKKQYPVKPDLNLAQREHRHRDLREAAALALVLALGIGLFCKFCVIDPLGEVGNAQASADRMEQSLAQVRAQTTDYDRVLKEYQSHTLAQAAMGGTADAMECLDLMEERLLSRSQVSAFTMADSLISVQLSGVTLEEVSDIYTGLMASDLVKNVQVYTAATNGAPAARVEANMTIQLAGDPAEEVGQEEAAAS